MSTLVPRRLAATAVMLAAIGLAFGTAIAARDAARRADVRAAVAESGNVRRLPLRAALLAEGTTLAEVKRIMGDPIGEKVFADAQSEARVVSFSDQGVATRVSFEDGRLVGVSLDLAEMSVDSLPPFAKRVKAGMTRSGVVMLLGQPAEERLWMGTGLPVSQMVFDAGAEGRLSVFLANGLVMAARAGTDAPEDLLRVTLPIDPFELETRMIASAAAGEATSAAWSVAAEEGGPLHLRIGMAPQEVRAIYGDACRTQDSSFKGLPVKYELYEYPGRNLRLTFTGGALTEFAAGRQQTRDAGDALASSCTLGALPS